jgi:hypothetical protein
VDRELKRSGVLAQAEILEISGNRVGHHDQPFPVPVRFRLRVHPEGAEPVEVELKQNVPNDRAYHLEPGAWVPVVHDPKDPGKVAVDLAEESAAAQAAAEETVATQQEYMETIRQMTGEDPNGPKTQADVTEAIKMAQQMAEQNVELVDWAKRAGVPGMTPPGGAPAPPPAGSAGGGQGEDSIAKLERLTKLRDSGAISDDEFERLKAEILG